MLIEIGHVDSIFRYPVKSMGGERLETAELGWHGIEGDRRLAFRRMNDHSAFPWLTAGKLPDLLLFAPLRRDSDAHEDGAQRDSLLPTHIRTPDGTEMPVFGEDLAAEVGRRYGAPVEMMQMKHGIFDDASISVIALDTVHEIGRLAGLSADVRRFRPNVVVRSLRPVPFQEDEWLGGVLSFGEGDDAPTVAVINRHFAGTMFGSVTGAIGRRYKLQDGTRVQVVGVVEDGKYMSLTEAQQPAMFLPYLQSPASAAYLVVRSSRDPQQLAALMRTKVHELDAGLPVDTQSWTQMLEVVLFPARVATMALGVLGVMGAMLSITGIFGMAAYSVSKRLRELGIRMALGAPRKEVLHAALGRPFKLLTIGSAAGLAMGLLATRVLAFIVYQATPRDPFVLAGVVIAMSLLGLLATWIPAQRALSVNPTILLRED